MNWCGEIRRETVKHLDTPLLAVKNARRGENAEVFRGRLEGESNLFRNVPDTRLPSIFAPALEETQNREPATIRQRFHNSLKFLFRQSLPRHIHLFYHSRELEKVDLALISPLVSAAGDKRFPDDEDEGDSGEEEREDDGSELFIDKRDEESPTALGR